MITLQGTTKGFKMRFNLDKQNKLICSYSDKDVLPSYCGAGDYTTWFPLEGFFASKADFTILNQEGVPAEKIAKIKDELLAGANTLEPLSIQ